MTVGDAQVGQRVTANDNTFQPVALNEFALLGEFDTGYNVSGEFDPRYVISGRWKEEYEPPGDTT
jgi:hypothetical protein